MLVSLEKQFLFIHVAKAAGTSIRDTLMPHCVNPKQYWINRVLERVGIRVNRFGPFPCHRFRIHDTARIAKFWLPSDIFEGLFKFAFVRNPWDRMVSMYSYVLMRTDHHRHREVTRLSGLEDYLKYEMRRKLPSQFEAISDRHGKLIVDYIGRFERLETDFAEVCRRVGIEYRLGHRNRAPHEPYQQFYNDRSRKLVAEYFAREIEFFGYEFETVVHSPTQPLDVPKRYVATSSQ